MKHKKFFLIKVWEKQSLTVKFILIFVIVLLNILLVTGLSIKLSERLIKSRINNLVQNDTMQKMRLICMEIESYSDFLFQMATDETIIEPLREINKDNNTSHQWLMKSKIEAHLPNYGYSKSNVVEILIVSSNGILSLFDKEIAGPNESIRKYWSNIPDINNSEIYNRMKSHYGNSLGFTKAIKLRKDSFETNSYLIFLGQKICYLKKKIETLGIVSIAILEDSLENLCNQTEYNNFSYSFLIDQEGTIITYKDDTIIGRNISEVFGDLSNYIFPVAQKEPIIHELNYEGEKSIVSTISVPNTPWTLVSTFNYKYFFQDIQEVRNIFLLIIISSIFITCGILVRISISITASVRKLTSAMKGAQKGNLTNQVYLDTHNELTIIAENYNILLEEFNKLIEKMKQASIREKNAEIRALEAQLNPHFLYNTLDAINWIAIDNDQNEISEMISRLSNILRYSVNGSNKIVLIKDELNWIEDYLYIQKVRYSNRFNYDVDISPEVLECKIHKLLFQPFIENAIIHGLSKSHRNNGFLQIKIQSEDDERIRFIISDNGKGMDEELVSKYFKSKLEDFADVNNIGVRNIIERLNLYYGETYQLSVSSKVNHGTCISVIFPKTVV